MSKTKAAAIMYSNSSPVWRWRGSTAPGSNNARTARRLPALSSQMSFWRTPGSVSRHGSSLTAKVCARFRLSRFLRAELGAGGSDDSNGKSVAADVAVVAGDPDEAKVWRPYGAVRFAGSIGIPPNPGAPVAADNTPPPNALFLFGTLGASGRVSDHLHYVGEAGVGGIRPASTAELGIGVYLGIALLATIGEPRAR